jgi:ubiquinone/menaquinone biosynthesis C-methylase UbiE
MSATIAKKAYKGMAMEGFIARWYARNTGQNLQQFTTLAREIAKQLPSGSHVLEVAPGPGFLAIELAKLGSYEITGLDISQSFVRMAQDHAARAGAKVTFRQGNASAMPFEAQSFDFICCRAAFKNFSEPVRAISEMHRVLKPGGKAVIYDLRNDASPEDIKAAVAEMGLSWFNRMITRWIFRHFLLKRAYSEEDFRRMVAQTPFGTCAMRRDSIGLEVILQRQNP